MRNISKILLMCILFSMFCCKKENDSQLPLLKVHNFNSDKIITGLNDRFICIDYLSASIITIDVNGTKLWRLNDLFAPKDPLKKSDEKPIIKSLKNGDLMIWEQIVDSFLVASSQFFCHWKVTRLNENGTLIFKNDYFLKDKKLVMPFNFVELEDATIFGIGIVETNKISGAISLIKIDPSGALIWSKSINPAGYWLNGIFPNEKTSIKLCANGQETMAIVQIGIQTSCFKFDSNGNNTIPPKKYNYTTEDGIQQQIDAVNYLECPIVDIQKLNENEFFLSGIKFSGKDYTVSNNKFFKNIFSIKINSNFEILSSKEYSFDNYQTDAIPMINNSQVLTFISNESDDFGGDNHLLMLEINTQNLELISKLRLPGLINYQALSSKINSSKIINIAGTNSVFGSLGKHTFTFNLKNE
jgi:hypothetical protein